MKEYFSHDYDARDDDKMPKLLSEVGYEGYGIYWALIEQLYKNNGIMQLHCKSIAFALHCDEICLTKVINDFDLFVINGGTFTSESVLRRLSLRNEISEKRRDAAKSRVYAKDMQLHSKTDANGAKIKEKKTKEKEIIYSDDFLTFWSEYPNKEKKKDSFIAWNKAKNKPEINLLIQNIIDHKKTDKWKKGFIPLPTTFLNGRLWEDEIKPISNRPEFTM